MKTDITRTDTGSDGGDDLLKVVQLTAMNVNGISKQMGLVLDKIDGHDKRITALEDRMDSHERTEVVNRAQANRIHDAIRDRVTYVLGLDTDGGMVSEDSIPDEVRYRSAFINKCHVDARRHSKLAKPYYATLKVDFDEVMQYISAWYPEVRGKTEGYKRYLDIRREERRKARA